MGNLIGILVVVFAMWTIEVGDVILLYTFCGKPQAFSIRIQEEDSDSSRKYIACLGYGILRKTLATIRRDHSASFTSTIINVHYELPLLSMASYRIFQWLN